MLGTVRNAMPPCLVFVAEWTPAFYEVQFMVDGSTYCTELVDIDDHILTYPVPPSVQDGQRFIGWSRVDGDVIEPPEDPE